MGSRSPSAPAAMHIESEIKLAVAPTFRLPSLSGIGTTLSDRVSRSTTTFYDTPDLALASWGCLLRCRSREGWTVKLPPLDASPTLDRPEQAVAGQPDEPPAAALEVLAVVLRGRAVAPVARVTARRRLIQIGERERPLVDVVDDRVQTTDGEPRALRQLEIELRDSTGSEIFDAVVRRLVRAGAEAGDQRTKYAWALGERMPPPEIDPPQVDPRSTARDVIRRSVAADVVALVAHDARIRGGHDPEAIHDARVAVRRLRSDLRAFRPILDRAWAEGLRTELEWVGALLGAVRDRDVLARRIRVDGRRLDDAEVGTLIGVLDREIADARAALDETMRTGRYLDLLGRLIDAANEPRLRRDDGAAADLLKPALTRAWKRLRRAAKRARAGETSGALHRVRIEAKRVRYVSEALAPVLGKRTSRLARAATELQDVLGEHQDAVVAREWLRARSEMNGSPSAFLVGELSALQIVARDGARARWADAWKALRPWRPKRP